MGAWPAGPDDPERSVQLAEGTMGYVLFILIAFVMLGVQKFVEYRRSHQHGIPISPPDRPRF
jgi:hypothetical protein